MLSLSGAVSIVIYLIVAGLVFWLLTWLIDYCGIPQPFAKVAKCVIAVIAVLVIIGVLLGAVSGQPLFRP